MNNLINKIRNFLKYITKKIWLSNDNYLNPFYRIVEVIQDKNSTDYLVTVQLIGKSSTFKEKPEKLLADDNIIDRMLPRDIRALSYLGYLGMNSPKYKLLAKKLALGPDKTLFAIKNNINGNVSVKTADDISNNKEILNSLNQEEAHMVGFISATEQNEANEMAMKALKNQKEKE